MSEGDKRLRSRVRPCSRHRLWALLGLCALLGLWVADAPVARATVTVTAATGGTAISADTAGGAYTSLGNIVIDEGADTDFAADLSNATLVLNAPTGFAFDAAGAPSVMFLPNRDITAASVTVTSAAVTVTFSTDGVANNSDELTISNLPVRPTAGAPLASGQIYRPTIGGGTVGAVAGITTTDNAAGSGGTNFGTLTEVPGAAVKLLITTQPSGATAGSAFTTQPVVRSADQFNTFSTNGFNPNVNITATIQTGSGTLQGTATLNIGTNGGNGAITFTDLRIDTAQSGVVLRFSAGGLTVADSTPFTVNAASASKLIVTTQPTGATAGNAFVTQPVVKSADAFNNPSTVGLGASVNVTATVQSGAGVLQGTTTLDIGAGAGNGTVAYTNLRLDVAQSGVMLRFSATGLTLADSASFTVNAGSLNNFLVDAAGGGAIGAQATGVPFSIRLTARDAFNNIVTAFTGAGNTVVISSTGTLSAGGGTTATLTNGILASHSVTLSNAGAFTITATDSPTGLGTGTESGTSNAFVVSTPGFTIVESGGNTVVSEAGATDTFTVVLTTQLGGNVRLQVSSADTGEANAIPVELTFTTGNWNVPQTVTATGVDELLVDGPQVLLISVSVTIIDNDVAGFAISATTVSASESATTDTFTVVLSAQPLTNVVITVTITGVDDALVDGSQLTTVTLSIDDAASDDAFDPLADQTVTVTTLDTTPPPPPVPPPPPAEPPAEPPADPPAEPPPATTGTTVISTVIDLSSPAALTTVIDAITGEQVEAVQATSPDGNVTVTVTVPLTALGSDVTALQITVESLPAETISAAMPPPSGAFLVAGQTFGVTILDDSGDDLTAFASAITLAFHVDPAVVDLESLTVFFFDEAAGEWVPMPTTVLADGSVMISVDHLTVFAVLSLPVAVQPLTAGWNSMVFTGLDGSRVETLVERLGPDAASVWRWDPAAQLW